MSAVPPAFDHDQPPAGEGERLPKAAFAFYLWWVPRRSSPRRPYVVQISHEGTGWIAFAILAVRAARNSSSLSPRRGGSSEGTLSYHTTAVFLLPAALLLAPPLAALIPIAQHVPEWLKKRQPWYIGTFNIFNYTLTILATLAVNRWVLGLDGLIPNANLRIATGALLACVVYVLVNHSLLSTMFRLGAVSPSRVRSFHRRGAPPSSCSRRSASPSRPSGTRSLADPARARAARRDQPLARGAGPQDGGAHRPEDRPLQRTTLRHRARRRANARAAFRPAAVGDDGRPRPAARHQQQLRPSRGRRGPARDCRCLPRGAAPLRRACALRRRGVLDLAPRDDRNKRSRSQNGSAGHSPSAGSRSRHPASRSRRPSPSASPDSPPMGQAPTS